MAVEGLRAALAKSGGSGLFLSFVSFIYCFFFFFFFFFFSGGGLGLGLVVVVLLVFGVFFLGGRFGLGLRQKKRDAMSSGGDYPEHTRQKDGPSGPVCVLVLSRRINAKGLKGTARLSCLSYFCVFQTQGSPHESHLESFHWSPGSAPQGVWSSLPSTQLLKHALLLRWRFACAFDGPSHELSRQQKLRTCPRA